MTDCHQDHSYVADVMDIVPALFQVIEPRPFAFGCYQHLDQVQDYARLATKNSSNTTAPRLSPSPAFAGVYCVISMAQIYP